MNPEIEPWRLLASTVFLLCLIPSSNQAKSQKSSCWDACINYSGTEQQTCLLACTAVINSAAFNCTASCQIQSCFRGCEIGSCLKDVDTLCGSSEQEANSIWIIVGTVLLSSGFILFGFALIHTIGRIVSYELESSDHYGNCRTLEWDADVPMTEFQSISQSSECQSHHMDSDHYSNLEICNLQSGNAIPLQSPKKSDVEYIAVEHNSSSQIKNRTSRSRLDRRQPSVIYAKVDYDLTAASGTQI